MSTVTLLDETTRPSLRTLFRELLTHARSADIAIGTIRLGALDLSSSETAHVRMRILLGRFEALSLHGVADTDTTDSGTAELAGNLRRLIAGGTVQLRSAGIGWWTPDFSLFRKLRDCAYGRDVCLVGAHYFHTPPSSTGPSFTCVLQDATAVAAAAARFEQLWQRGYDVSAIIDDTLGRLRPDA